MSARLQADFADALFNPGRSTPAGLRAWNGSDPCTRFGVHRNNVLVSLVQALAETFVVVRRLVGSDFFDAMAAHYVRTQPPSSPVLARYGAGFADWLATSAPAPARALPYLPDMARLEHARVVAFHAADAAPLAAQALAAKLGEPNRLPLSRPLLHPSCGVLRSDFAVHAVWAAHQQDDEWPPMAVDQPCAMLVLRDPDDEVLVIQTDAAAAAFISALLTQHTLAGALHQAPEVDLAGTLALLLRHGAIVGWH